MNLNQYRSMLQELKRGKQVDFKGVRDVMFFLDEEAFGIFKGESSYSRPFDCNFPSAFVRGSNQIVTISPNNSYSVKDKAFGVLLSQRLGGSHIGNKFIDEARAYAQEHWDSELLTGRKGLFVINVKNKFDSTCPVLANCYAASDTGTIDKGSYLMADRLEALEFATSRPIIVDFSLADKKLSVLNRRTLQVVLSSFYFSAPQSLVDFIDRIRQSQALNRRT